jgi:alkaline phosphatase D
MVSRVRPLIDRRRFLRQAMALAAASLVPAGVVRAQTARVRFTGYPFTLGVASGYPRPDGFSLWTRLAPEPLQIDGGIDRGDWLVATWQVSDDERFGRVVAQGEARAVHELGRSIHVDVTGLRPGRRYFYRFIAGDEISPVGRTLTTPLAGRESARLRFAFGSCQHYEQGYFEAYRHLLADAPDLMVFLGDYVYENSWGDDLVRRHVVAEPYELDDYRLRHAQYKTDPDLQAAHASMPWLLTWDDHEVDNDPAGDTAEHLDPRFLLRRAAAYQAYYEHMPLPRAMAPRVDGSMRIHGELAFGEHVRFFMLDNRQYRTANACNDPVKGGGSTDVVPAHCAELRDPSRSMLGLDQERWLSHALSSSNARWNILSQQTLVTPVLGRDGDGRSTVWTDSWDGFPAARERLYRELERPALRNPVVIGGDLHANVVCDIRRDTGRADSPVLAAEICGTSISSQGWPQAMYDDRLRDNPHLRFARSDRRGYALVTIERDARVDLRVIDTEKKRGSIVETAASFVVEDGRRGVEPA